MRWRQYELLLILMLSLTLAAILITPRALFLSTSESTGPTTAFYVVYVLTIILTLSTTFVVPRNHGFVSGRATGWLLAICLAIDAAIAIPLVVFPDRVVSWLTTQIPEWMVVTFFGIAVVCTVGACVLTVCLGRRRWNHEVNDGALKTQDRS